MKTMTGSVIFGLLFSFCLLWTSVSFAQQRQPLRCATPKPTRSLPEVPVDYVRTQNISGARMIKLYIHIFQPEWSYALPCQDEATILAHLEYMRQYFAPYGICFILQGIESIISNDLSFIDADDDSTEFFLQPYMKPGCLNMFIHCELDNVSNGGLIGQAYHIPNTFVSLDGSFTWPGYPMLAAHEVAHCLGLYHTFEDYFGKEWIARSGSCSNCGTAGDKICDTEADLDTDANFSNCVYTGNVRDSCNNQYVMEPSNLMSYHNFSSCVPYFHFSPGQANRFTYFIDNDPSLSALLLTNNTFTETTNRDYSSTQVEHVSRNNITVNAASYIARDAVRLQMSSEEIVIKPGAHFYPNGNGIVVLRANTLCQ